MPNVRKNPSKTLGTGGLAPVTPIEVDRVRRTVLDVVRKQMPSVREVLDGNKFGRHGTSLRPDDEWSPQPGGLPGAP